MTSKTNGIAMFAVAAFAVLALGINPALQAYADDQITTNYVNNTPTGQIQTSPTDHDDCGTGGDCSTYTKVYNSGTNKIKTYYNVVGETCDVDMVMKKNGSTVYTYHRDNYSGTGSFVSKSTAISPTDDITVTTTFTC